MKIIFADIDGVFTSARTGWSNFDLYAVNFICWICEKSGAKIVISSTWRMNHSLGFFRQIFNDHIFRDGDWKTPYVNSAERRGGEVRAWLEKHEEIEKYLILDDDSDFLPEQMPFLIKTSSQNGMLFDHMMKIRDFFEVKEVMRESKKLYQHPSMFGENNNDYFEPQSLNS